MDFDPALPWYHGSPVNLTILRVGSTITQKEDLARIFSHKPAIVCISDDGQIRHNGALPGYLYTIAEMISPGDVVPHPRTTMVPGDEWLTTRELRVRLLRATEPAAEERLTAEELSHYRHHL
jgi:hypothetical protein